LDYDYDDLAHQLQTGLERIAINFLRGHSARVRRDLVDFHGYEQVDLEVSHDGHTLKVHQAGPPRGPGMRLDEVAPAGFEETFECTFDGWPASDVPRETLVEWLADLPPGEAPPERSKPAPDGANPLAEQPAPSPRVEHEPSFNPFMSEQPRRGSSNPFADTDRERKRQEMLRRLRGDED